MTTKPLDQFSDLRRHAPATIVCTLASGRNAFQIPREFGQNDASHAKAHILLGLLWFQGTLAQRVVHKAERGICVSFLAAGVLTFVGKRLLLVCKDGTVFYTLPINAGIDYTSLSVNTNTICLYHTLPRLAIPCRTYDTMKCQRMRNNILEYSIAVFLSCSEVHLKSRSYNNRQTYTS